MGERPRDKSGTRRRDKWRERMGKKRGGRLKVGEVEGRRETKERTGKRERDEEREEGVRIWEREKERWRGEERGAGR